MSKLLDWEKRRLGQGYSHGEVVREIRRRAHGEYRLSLDASASALREGVERVGLRFRLSALLLDFMKNEGFVGGEEELLSIVGCTKEDDANVAASFMLNPYPKYEDQTLRTSEAVDEEYPGKSNLLSR